MPTQTEAERAIREVVVAAQSAPGGLTEALTFGPVPMLVRAEDEGQLADVRAHAVGAADGVFPPLRVVLATDASLPVADMPEPLRPSADPFVGTTLVRAGAVTAVVGNRMTWIVDDETGTAMRWTPTAADLPAWETGRPLRVALRWWSAMHDGALLHAAAVSRGGRAALLVGHGGAGKSTTAYACLGGDLDVLGDDYCLVRRHGDAVRVYATYRTGNLTESSLQLLPSLRGSVRGIGHQGKAILPLGRLREGAGHADVAAVAAVRQAPGQQTRLEPATAIEVLRALAPNTVRQVPGWAQETMAMCAAAVTSSSTYWLRVGAADQAPGVLADVLAEAA